MSDMKMLVVLFVLSLDGSWAVPESDDNINTLLVNLQQQVDAMEMDLHNKDEKFKAMSRKFDDQVNSMSIRFDDLKSGKITV